MSNVTPPLPRPRSHYFHCPTLHPPAMYKVALPPPLPRPLHPCHFQGRHSTHSPPPCHVLGRLTATTSMVASPPSCPRTPNSLQGRLNPSACTPCNVQSRLTFTLVKLASTPSCTRCIKVAFPCQVQSRLAPSLSCPTSDPLASKVTSTPPCPRSPDPLSRPSFPPCHVLGCHSCHVQAWSSHSRHVQGHTLLPRSGSPHSRQFQGRISLPRPKPTHPRQVLGILSPATPKVN